LTTLYLLAWLKQKGVVTTMEEYGPNSIEHRQTSRESTICLPDAELILVYDETRVDLIQIKDISPFGACLLASEPPLTDTLISIRYQRKNLQFEVVGKIVWQKPVVAATKENRHWVGVSFDPFRQTENFALFESITYPLKTLIAQKYMSKCSIVLQKHMKISSVVKELLHSPQQGGPIVDKDNHVIGFISEQDCIQKMMEPSYIKKSDETLASIMGNNVLTVDWNTPILELAKQMVRDKSTIYPVVDGEDKIIGVITRRDVLMALDQYFSTSHR